MMSTSKMTRKGKKFSYEESKLLIRLVMDQADTIESKETNKVSIFKKDSAWERVYHLFNQWRSEKDFEARELEQLKTKWDNLKANARKYIGDRRKERYMTGGGPREFKEDELLELVAAVIGASGKGYENRFDGDSKESLPKSQKKVADLRSQFPLIEQLDDNDNGTQKDVQDCQEVFQYLKKQNVISGWKSWSPAEAKRPLSEPLRGALKTVPVSVVPLKKIKKQTLSPELNFNPYQQKAKFGKGSSQLPLRIRSQIAIDDLHFAQASRPIEDMHLDNHQFVTENIIQEPVDGDEFMNSGELAQDYDQLLLLSRSSPDKIKRSLASEGSPTSQFSNMLNVLDKQGKKITIKGLCDDGCSSASRDVKVKRQAPNFENADDFEQRLSDEESLNEDLSSNFKRFSGSKMDERINMTDEELKSGHPLEANKIHKQCLTCESRSLTSKDATSRSCLNPMNTRYRVADEKTTLELAILRAQLKKEKLHCEFLELQKNAFVSTRKHVLPESK